MRAERFLFVAAVLCAACLIPINSYAVEGEEEQLTIDEETLLLEGCYVTWDCPVTFCNASVSCSGNSTCTSAPNYVECDGNRTYCKVLDQSCVMDCNIERMICRMNCFPMPDPPPDPCGCESDYQYCKYDCCYVE